MKKSSKLLAASLLTLTALGTAGVAAADSGAFSDVPANEWYSNAVSWVSSHGVMTGMGNGSFSPNSPVTRAQLAEAIYNMSSQGLMNGQSASKPPVTTPTSVPPIVNGYTATVFAQGAGMSKPDDITLLGKHIFVAYQNGVGSKGEASSSGSTSSTVVEYDQSGNVINKWDITGKCDGMTADPANNRVLTTVNEDGNSSLYIISPDAAQGQQIQHVTYSPDPSASSTTGALATGGGTDSIAIQNGNIYITASAPTADTSGNFTHAAVFQANIQGPTATLTPVLMDNATATDAASSKSVTLNLSDPDSSTIVPSSSSAYANDLMLNSQGDSQLIFVQNAGASNQSQTRLTLGTQVDDVTWATASQGTLYVTDNSDNKIYAITGNFKSGTAFVSCASDSGVASFVGTLDLASGTIQPFAISITNPHGLLFVPQGAQ